MVSTRPKEYSDDVKYLAQNIFYISQSTYSFLRNKLNLNLPHISTLNRWAPIKFLQPGIKNVAFDSIKSMCLELKEKNENHLVLLMDEMAIRKELRYNSKLDLIDGFECTGFERTNKIGKQVCVFMLKSMFSNWSSILNYFVSENGLTSNILCGIIKEILRIISSFGINITVLVCDQGSSNRKCFSNFGVSTEKPYFNFEGKNIYCMFDFPHLIKSLRNGLLKCDLKTPDGIISFKVIQELWEREENCNTKMCPKLTRQHIFPNSFEKMRVKFATQVLSKTVETAIKTICDTSGFKQSPQAVALSTAEFISKIDKIFDGMNSGSLYSDNCYRSAIQLNKEPHKFIQLFLCYLEGVKFVDEKKEYIF